MSVIRFVCDDFQVAVVQLKIFEFLRLKKGYIFNVAFIGAQQEKSPGTDENDVAAMNLLYLPNRRRGKNDRSPVANYLSALISDFKPELALANRRFAARNIRIRREANDQTGIVRQRNLFVLAIMLVKIKTLLGQQTHWRDHSKKNGKPERRSRTFATQW